MHKLLVRQIKKYLQETACNDERMARFLEIISDTYDDFDKDRELMEHAFDLSSDELRMLHKKVRAEADRQKDIIDKLRYILKAYDDCSYSVTGADEVTKDAATLIDDVMKLLEERKRAKTRAELFFQVVPSAIFTINSNKTVTSWNKRAEELTGYAAEEVIGSSCNIFSLNPCQHRCGLFDEVRAEDVVGEECTIRRKDGEVRVIVKNACYLRDEKGEIIGGVESFEDITERKRAEDELRQYREDLQKRVDQRTEELRKANMLLTDEIEERKKIAEALEAARDDAQNAAQAKGQFLANVSHEIRTPMNSIIGFSEIIRDSDDVETIHRHAQTILDESDMLLQLINSILDHAKFDAHTIELHPEVFDLAEQIAIVEKLFKKRAELKQLTLAFLIDDAVPPFIKADQLRFKQILINLIDNALKFTHEGSVTVTLSGTFEDTETFALSVTVSDTGIGIPEDRIKEIMNDFVQADGSTTREYGGTGLGTSIARRIVAAMGGELSVESVINKGSTFSFVIPVSVAECKDNAVPVSELTAEVLNTIIKESSTLPLKILLVEDYEPNQTVIQQYLKDVNVAIDVAVDGQEAINRAKEEQYAMILMDVQMPIVDGYVAAETIRKQNAYNQQVPIIAMTANADTGSQLACKHAGMNMIVTKPVRKNTLFKTVYQWIIPYAESRDFFREEAEKTECDLLPIRYEQVLDEFDNDKALLWQVITQFVKQAGRQIRTIEEAIEKNDYEVVRRESHKIRGGAANLTIDHVASAAEKLETLAEGKTLDGAGHWLETLTIEFKRVVVYIEHIFGEKKGE